MRAFIAIELEEENKKEIYKMQRELAKSGLFEGKFTEPENLHLTLKFLGEISEEKALEARKLLEEIKFLKFEAEFGELGMFSDRILWVKLEGKAAELQKEIDKKLEKLFKPEARFMGHITIARIKKIRDKKSLFLFFKKYQPGKARIKIKNFLLKKSTLAEDGPIYETLEKYKLG